MKSLLCMIPCLFDATSFYRGVGPMGRIRQQAPNLHFNFVNDWNWVPIHLSDAVFMQRPFKTDHLKVAQMVKEQGKKLWLDYDDDLFNVPTDNPAHKIYGDAEVQKAIAKMIAMADHVSVTTEHLKKQLDPLNKNIVVIPNAMDVKMFPYRQKKVGPRNKVMLWRGSATHHKDVMSYSNEIIELSNENKYADWIWRLVGDNLWFMTDQMPHKRVVWSQALDVMEYNRHIYDIAPTGIFVPLHESSFNKSKSNIAWLEGLFAGAVAIAPKWEEWEKPGCLNYSNPREFKNTMANIMAGNVNTEKLASEGWEYVMDTLDINKVNQKRIAIIEDCVGGKIS